MAVAHIAPKCPKCGAQIEGIYKNDANTPMHLRAIGDTFVRWNFEGHKCLAKDIERLKQKQMKCPVKSEGTNSCSYPVCGCEWFL